MDILPPEMLLTVFDYLDIIDLTRCARVCKRFSSLLREPSMEKPFIRYYPIISDRFASKDQLISADLRVMNRFIYHIGHEPDHNESIYHPYHDSHHVCRINLRVIASVYGHYLIRGGLHVKQVERVAQNTIEHHFDVSLIGLVMPSQGKLDLYPSQRLDEKNRKRLVSIFGFPLTRVAQWPGKHPFKEREIDLVTPPMGDTMVD